MKCLTIRRRGACVRLSGNAHSLTWVKQRGEIYFHFSSEEVPAETWQIIAGSEGTSKIPLEQVTRGAGEKVRYWLNREKRIVVVDAPAGAWLDLWTLRMVRHLLRWQLFHAGAVFLHGGLFQRNGQGTVLVGPSRAGKTTLLVRMLEIPGSALVGEDDITLIRDADGSVCALGWPGAIRVRRDGLGLLPGIANRTYFSHPANPAEAKLDPRIGRLRVFHEEMAELTGCKILPETKLGAVIDVGWAEQESATKITRDQIESALMASWDVLPERRPGTRPKPGPRNLWYWRNFCFNPFLLDCFGLPAKSPPIRTPADCAASLLGFRVRHLGSPDGVHSLVDGFA